MLNINTLVVNYLEIVAVYDLCVGAMAYTLPPPNIKTHNPTKIIK